ncbi:MAG: methionyl-tRNA formyltransferase [Acholeplasmataceae bacterium]|nr:methionyl-tRNA formyltransferase [Acholeplasmataceae bacterium]MDD4203628.1 methionyl-tRNA formyltransferase [Acholeplasmataceae bacterium]MDD4468859.1 methionyl-tRNA formyltransferase [Acholeplasmataceae bacterium]MDD4824174.1 methionyl-tRNA formyltransferase [Acholeplasmataceae bacterium]
MNIVFMGTPYFAVPILEKLNEISPINLVVTQPDKRVGRKQEFTYSPVKLFAVRHNLEVFQPKNIKTDYQRIIDIKPDIIVTAAYGQMIPAELIDHYTMVNIHGSLLPKYRGGAPVQRAIMNGDTTTGVTLMYMAQKMDSGSIIAQSEISIEEDDTTTSLMKKLSYVGRDLLVKNLEDILNKQIDPILQDESLVTFAYNLNKKDEILNFNQPTYLVMRQLNGLLDEPAASIFIKGVRIKVFKLAKSDIISSMKPGTVVSIDKELHVKTLDGVVRILELSEQGKKRMTDKAYLNGQKIICEGSVFNE